MRVAAWIVASALAVAGAAGWLSAGCTAPRPPLVVTHPDPSVKIPAYKKAVRERDRPAVRQFVKDLESDDPAVRLFAIEALERMTGQTHGYRYYDGDEQRREAVRRWQQWLRQRRAAREGAADRNEGRGSRS